MKNILYNLLFLLLLLFGGQVYSQEIAHVEPSFWWAGMQSGKLQVLVHGKNIGTTTPKLNYAGVKLISADKVENKNYLFLNIELDSEVKPGSFEIQFANATGKVKATYQYKLKQRRKGSANRESFSSKDVMYLIMPDRFANGDPSNDNIKGMIEQCDRSNPDGRHGGDLLGVEQKLDYIKDLGVTTIWVNPVLENDMPMPSYHGYATTDFYSVDARLGGNEAYSSLVKTAHSKDIKVVMDMIFNHCGSEHWWMKDLPMKNWLNQWDTMTETNYRGTTIVDPYAAKYDKDLMENGWFVPTMPDLNQKNKYVANYLIQNSIWWIEQGDIDGIRMDTHPYADKHMMVDWVKAVRAEYPKFMIVGEVWLDDPAALAYWGKGANNFDGFDSQLPGLIDFPFMFATKKAFVEKNGWWEGAAGLYYLLTKDYHYKDANSNLTFLDNHDLSRIWTELNGDMKLLKMAYTFLLTTRGIPMIYYGSEVLSDGTETDGHGHIRKDFVGGWKGDTRDSFTAKGRTKAENEIFDHLHKLMNWRKDQEAIHSGQLTHWVPEDNLYVYVRHTEKQKVLVLINKAEERRKFDIKMCAELLDTYSKGRDVLTGKVHDLNTLKVEALTSMVLELK